MVWERLNISPLSSILPKQHLPKWQKIIWGIIPFLTVIICFIINVQIPIIRKLGNKKVITYKSIEYNRKSIAKNTLKVFFSWMIIVLLLTGYSLYLFYIKNDAHRNPENIITAYYDALDFKEFKKAHNLLHPNANLPIAEYMLQIAVSDGLLSSYAKLDAIETKILKQNDSVAEVKVFTDWITPLENIHKTYDRTVEKVNGKWYVIPNETSNDLPPDQLYTLNTTNFYNHGRRRVTTEKTYHEDVLKQPEIEVLSARLIKCNTQYTIVGEIQNIDNVPADVILKGSLYTEDNQLLADYNAKDLVKHKLLPKETSAFRINFQGIAWSSTKDSIPKTFNPDEFTPIHFESEPVKFNLHVAGNATNSDLFKNLSISNLKVNINTLSGTLFNSGLQEITVPQVLISYFDKHKNLLWVSHKFLEESVRQQRTQDFIMEIPEGLKPNIISEDMEHVFVNGLPNKQMKQKTMQNRIQVNNQSFIPVKHKKFSFIKIETNGYIGNPR